MRNPKTGGLDDCGIFGCQRPSTPRSNFCPPCRSWLYRWLHMSRKQQDRFIHWHELRGGRFSGFLGRGKKVLRFKKAS